MPEWGRTVEVGDDGNIEIADSNTRHKQEEVEETFLSQLRPARAF